MIKANEAWPMATYLTAWKAFRRLGNEPSATAAHLLSRPLWPKRSPLRILDVGAGDGRMLEALLLKAPQTVSRVILLDPDERLLVEAESGINAVSPGIEIASIVGVAESEGAELAKGADVGLGIHLVYLMENRQFRTFIERWPSCVPLYIVLDAPSSVFTALWTHTAPEFAKRAEQVHAYFANARSFTVNRTEFATRVANPYSLAPNVCDLVLSLLCYCDYSTLSAEQCQIVRNILERYIDGDEVKCTCTSYELLKG